jgi:hypothetical protein
MMQKLATQVLSVMTACGSPIKVFSSKPNVAVDDLVKLASDSNGHQWPEYNYIRGKVMDLMAKESVVAVPLLNVDLEMPSDLVLHRILYEQVYITGREARNWSRRGRGWVDGGYKRCAKVQGPLECLMN